MLVVITPKSAQVILRDQLKTKRLQREWTQKELAERSGVSLHTLRHFERTSMISLQSFLKLLAPLEGLEDLTQAIQIDEKNYKTIDDVIKDRSRPLRKRGKSK